MFKRKRTNRYRTYGVRVSDGVQHGFVDIQTAHVSRRVEKMQNLKNIL